MPQAAWVMRQSTEQHPLQNARTAMHSLRAAQPGPTWGLTMLSIAMPTNTKKMLPSCVVCAIYWPAAKSVRQAPQI